MADIKRMTNLKLERKRRPKSERERERVEIESGGHLKTGRKKKKEFVERRGNRRENDNTEMMSKRQ